MNVTPNAPSQRREDARRNRGRIIEAGIGALARNPDASIEEIAQAAGLARRTVYGHFPTREVLITAIADIDAVAVGVAARTDDPVSSLAQLTIAVFEVVDRYQVVIGLHRRAGAEAAVRQQLGAVRERVANLLGRGQRTGQVRGDVPAKALALMVEGIAVGAVSAVLVESMQPTAAARAAVVTMLGAIGLSQKDSTRIADAHRL